MVEPLVLKILITACRKLLAVDPESNWPSYCNRSDSAEHERLKLQHDAIKLSLGGNFLVPLHQKAKVRNILDLCHGSGQWVVEMATEFPEAEVVGVDIAEPQSLNGVPRNAKFLKHDINARLPFPDQSFDFVQMRVVPSIPDRKFIAQEISRILRPGGFVAFLEPAESFSGKTNTRTPALVEAERLMVLSPHMPRARAEGTDGTSAKSWSIAKDIAPMLRDAVDSEGENLFCAVQSTEIFMPIGAWPKDALQKQIGGMIARVQITLMDAVAAEVRDDDLKIQWPIVYAWGRKVTSSVLP
ncbi:S-adenosyl-L-methionine-dependent methyltransferase [Hygrophoropsis aurantiaca]|uniref:S-adenosyl-L-methionine-dependent methyltransferase n=1 Tax=Hygrophoropsis aurantiaca TaxID=72124 RepID=A0ACB8A2G6_9AGAM|nr:S-adenosyl-L-methionine-dependent methyltransferase [Hygrophoropsis aurantiaca]